MSQLERQLAAARSAAGGADEVVREVPSVLLDARAAGATDLAWAFQVGENGFAELCGRDARFLPFGASLFSPEALRFDRERASKEANASIDGVLDGFLRLSAQHASHKAVQKALEWLVRRFHVHRYNVRAVLDVFLPLHETQLFARIVSILHLECVCAVSLALRARGVVVGRLARAGTRCSASWRG
jgi:U3 small nucleolar RNA-associated protein 10